MGLCVSASKQSNDVAVVVQIERHLVRDIDAAIDLADNLRLEFYFY